MTVPAVAPPANAEPSARVARISSIVVCVWAGLILVRTAPLSADYLQKVNLLHGPGVTAFALAAGALLFAGFAAALRVAPRAVAILCTLTATLLTIPSGNFVALPVALLILLVTLLLGDAVFRVVSGEEARGNDIVPLFASGLVAGGLFVLVMGELRALGRWSLIAAAIVILAVRFRRIRELSRESKLHFPERLSWLDSFTLTFVISSLLAVWVIALTPDVSWDALMYHLPEIRDIVIRNRVEMMPDLLPQTLFWRNHEAYLSIGYFFGGERPMRILHFFAGVATFGAIVLLAQQLGRPVRLPILLLAIAAYPFGMYQLRATYVDWVCGLLVTSAAVALLDRERRARAVMAGLFFGGAIATKIFAIFAAPALLILLVKRGRTAREVAGHSDVPRSTKPGGKTYGAFIPGSSARERKHAREIGGFVLGVVLTLGPWMMWSHTHSGFFLALLAEDGPSLVNRITGGYFLVSPTLDHSTSTAITTDQDSRPARGVSAMLRLPWTLTFESSRYEAFGNGYGGVVALMLLAGVFGWSFRHFVLFLVAVLPPLVVWFLMYDPSSRYLMPLYPLYAAFAVVGLTRMTGNFAGREGRAAAALLIAGALALPVQFGSSGVEWKAALGLLSREEALAAQVPGYPLMKRLRPEDRVVFFGAFDRYHCPAEVAFRVQFSPVQTWGSDPIKWRSGLRELGITHILYRDELHPHGPSLADLADLIELEAEHGIARLYRVTNETNETNDE